jgi:hypothetical protein
MRRGVEDIMVMKLRDTLRWKEVRHSRDIDMQSS